MKRVLTLVFFMLLFIPNCYANESNIIIESIKEEGKLTMDFSSGSSASYGFSTKLEYDAEKMKLVNCTGHNGFDVTYNDNYIVVENVTGSSSTKMATCTFNIIEDETMDVKVNDIMSSDYTKAVDNGDFNLKLRKGESEIIIENVPNTSAELTIMYIAFGFLFMLFGGILLMKFMNHKKMAGIAIFMLLLLIPLSTYAARDKSSLSDTDLSNIRKMLLNEKDVDNELDLDGDKNITINDLVITKVDLYALNIDFYVTNYKKESGALSAVYLSLEKNIKVTSTADITSLKYCVDYKKCEPNKEVKINKKVKELYEKVVFNENNSSSKQRICVTATNSKGKVRTICDIGYIIDNATPVANVKDDSVNVDVNKLGSYDMRNNIEATFGYSGGNVTCKKEYVSTNNDKTTDIYIVDKVVCTVRGNNGKTVSAQYVLNEIDSFVPVASAKSYISIYTELLSTYDFRQNVTATFGKKGGSVSCADKVVVNEEDTSIHRTHNVTCLARGNNTKETSVSYKIVEFDNVVPYFDVKKESVDFEANTSSDYDYTNNIINSRFGIKGGSVSCTAGHFANNSGTSNNLYRSKVVTCVADGNNGQIYKRNYTIRELDNVTPTISFKSSIVDIEGVTPSGYNYASNISSVQYGAKGGNVSCVLTNTTLGDSNVYRNKTVTCTATGNNGRRTNGTYTIRELDNTTPLITAARSEIQFTNTSSEGYNLASNVGATYGLKGGSISCDRQAYTYNTNTSSNIYRIANVLCYANGNNGKRGSVSYSLVELDTIEPTFGFNSSLVSTTTDINSYNYLSNMINIRFGAKNGTKYCNLYNVTSGDVGNNIYKSGTVRCTAQGNNGKQLVKTYTLQELDNVTPYFTFKAEAVTVTTELLNDLSSNIATITYGKKGGTVSCEKIPTASAYAVKCTATGNNGLTYTNTYKMTY